MSKDDELEIFMKELERLEEDYQKCDFHEVREMIQQDIMLLRSVIEELHY